MLINDKTAQPVQTNYMDPLVRTVCQKPLAASLSNIQVDIPEGKTASLPTLSQNTINYMDGDETGLSRGHMISCATRTQLPCRISQTFSCKTFCLLVSRAKDHQPQGRELGTKAYPACFARIG
jgi:hypothetical protein